MSSKERLNKVIDATMFIGDESFKNYKETKGIEEGKLTIKAYNMAIRAIVVDAKLNTPIRPKKTK